MWREEIEVRWKKPFRRVRVRDELVNYFDWALTEQCWEFGECALFKNCTRANQWHINSRRRDLELVGPTSSDYLYQPRIPDTQATW